MIPQKKTRRANTSTFSFQQHCILCGEDCNLEGDPKNPTRWKPAYLCREIEPKGDNKSLKQSLLDICDCRDDDCASTVRLRISDLHAADARYHVTCRYSFTGLRAVETAPHSKTTSKSVDAAFNSLIQTVKEDLARVWNSVELFNLYVEYGGNNLSRNAPVTPELRSSRLPHAQKILPGMATAWPVNCFCADATTSVCNQGRGMRIKYHKGAPSDSSEDSEVLVLFCCFY